MHSIVILQVYFGRSWPEWNSLYLASCEANPTVQWRIYTNLPAPANCPSNVAIIACSPEGFLKRASQELETEFPVELVTTDDAYKLCDFKPLFPRIFQDDTKDFDFVGYGDMDVIYGNLRKFFDDEVLRSKLISTHEWCVSGHFCLLENSELLRNAFRRVKAWRTLINTPSYSRFDEDYFHQVFKYAQNAPRPLRALMDLANPNGAKLRRSGHFKEYYTTPFTPTHWRDGSRHHPETWHWIPGRVWAGYDYEQDYPYLHFMNFKASAYRSSWHSDRKYWEALERFFYVPDCEVSKGVKISGIGIWPMLKPPEQCVPIPRQASSIATPHSKVSIRRFTSSAPRDKLSVMTVANAILERFGVALVSSRDLSQVAPQLKGGNSILESCLIKITSNTSKPLFVQIRNSENEQTYNFQALTARYQCQVEEVPGENSTTGLSTPAHSLIEISRAALDRTGRKHIHILACDAESSNSKRLLALAGSALAPDLLIFPSSRLSVNLAIGLRKAGYWIFSLCPEIMFAIEDASLP